jgi:ankyrin repeat protein
LSGKKVTATQADDGKPAPKKSAAKVTAGALVKAAAAGDLDAVKKHVVAKAKLDVRGQYGYSPLIAAIANDKLEVALYLIEQGPGVTFTDKEKNDPLKWAAIRSGWVMAHQNVRLAEALLDSGAPVDSRDKDGFTPLIWAANRGAVKLVKLLLARGADVNAKTTQKHNSGRTALMYSKDIAVVRVLLDAGADPKAVEENGMHTWEFHTGAAAKLLKERAGVK